MLPEKQQQSLHHNFIYTVYLIRRYDLYIIGFYLIKTHDLLSDSPLDSDTEIFIGPIGKRTSHRPLDIPIFLTCTGP